MTLRQLTALLALPATARPLLYAAAAGLRSHGIRASQARSAAFSTTSVPAAKHMKTAAFSIPEYSTSTPLGLTPAQLFEHSSLSSVASGDNLEDALSDLFTRNPATFYHGNPNFYHLRKNTRIPEVCILGRSNVGKSSLVNAVANRMGSELARVSKKAGHTKTINSYGFGPAPRPEKGEVAVGAEFKGKEEMPKHMFFLVDMPGYGHGSLQEWGKNIALYLQKRTALKGAVMLIDAEVGPKDSDWTAIELMANAGLRTAIVLTKADKVKTGNEGLLKTCKTVWDGIRQIEAQLAESNKKWTWEKEFYVTATGATDATIRRATITTARLVVARLAGLVKDTRPESVAEQKWSGKIVSFDELFGDASSEATKTSPVEPALPETNMRVAPDEWEDVGEVEEESAAMEEERDALAALETRMQERRHRESAPNRMASNDAVWGSLSDRNSSSSTRPEAPIRQDSKQASKKSSSKYANESTAKYSNKSQSKSPNKSPGKPQNKPQKKPQNKSQNKPSGRKATPTPTPTAPKIPTDPFSRMLAAGRPAAGGRNQRLPKASFFHTSSTHARPTTTITTTAATTPDPESQTQPHPLTKEELDVVLAEFVATLQPSTSLRDLVRQRKLDMEMGVGQPSPEAMRQSWVDRLERNKQDLAARYLHETRQIREVRDRRLAHEEEKLRRQEAMLADQRSLEGDADWVAIKREMRQLEREKKRADEAAVAAAVVESRRGEVDGEGQRDVERDEGHAEEEDGVYRRGRRPALEADEVDMPPARQGAKRSKRGKLDEFDKVFASKLGGGGGGNSGGKGDKAGKSKTSRPSF